MIAARTSASIAGLLDWLPESVTATAAAHAATAAAASAQGTLGLGALGLLERRGGGPLPVLIFNGSAMCCELERPQPFSGRDPLHRV